MSLVMTGCYFFVRPGEKMFKVASNFTNYVEIGLRETGLNYLEAKIEANAFVLNATLLDRQGKVACQVVNNFPEGSGCRKEMTPHGYQILDHAGDLLLGIEVAGDLCQLKGTLYGANGDVVAKEEGNDFLILRGPAILGKSGGAVGIVLR